jgi:hypothetical protein
MAQIMALAKLGQAAAGAELRGLGVSRQSASAAHALSSGIEKKLKMHRHIGQIGYKAAAHWAIGLGRRIAAMRRCQFNSSNT